MARRVISLLVLGGLGVVVLTLLRVWRGSGELVHPAKRKPATTPMAFGLAAEPIEITASDGTSLRGWFIPASDQARGTIVFCHGYAGDCSPDLIYAPLFHDAHYNVCLFDFRGHGQSDGNFTSLVYFERGDLLAVLDLLKQRGIEKVGLIGFSMGGAVALATAPLSSMVVGVISDCTFAELKNIISRAAMVRGIPGFIAVPLSWLVVFLAGLSIKADLFSADPIRVVHHISPTPILIMHGEEDEAIAVSEAYRLYHAAREPKELWIVPNANHRQIESVAPEEYRKRLVAFFDLAFAVSDQNTQ